MQRPFTVKGINPINSEVAEVVLLAETVMDAKAQAEACGLRFVIAREYHPHKADSSDQPEPHEGPNPSC